MDTLSDVSEYLNNLETLMDDGDSSEIRMGKIKKSEEELEMFEALKHKSVVVEVNKYKVVVFTKAPSRDYSELSNPSSLTAVYITRTMHVMTPYKWKDLFCQVLKI
ncbi:hypothetical protein Tco_0780049 [Tanacetum coccineum]